VVGHTLFLAGSGFLALGMLCAIFVVATFLFDVTTAVIAVTVLVAIVAFTWYVLPIRRGRDPRVRESE
jgi:hypothetical protein